MYRHRSGCIRQVWSSSSPAPSGIVARSPRMCSSAEAPAPGGWVAWLGWASCCGSPSRIRFRAAPATASTLASDSCPASSTNKVSTLSAIPARAHSHAVPAATSSSPSRSAFSSCSLLIIAASACRCGLSRSARCPIRGPGSAPPRVLVHRVDQVADDRVRRPGDPDRAAMRDQLEDLLGRGVRLPGPRRSLHRQVRTPERDREPDRCGLRRFALGAGRSGPARTATVRGGRRSSSAVAASPPPTPSRTTRSPRSRSRSRCSHVLGGPASTRAAGHGPA